MFENLNKSANKLDVYTKKTLLMEWKIFFTCLKSPFFVLQHQARRRGGVRGVRTNPPETQNIDTMK